MKQNHVRHDALELVDPDAMLVDVAQALDEVESDEGLVLCDENTDRSLLCHVLPVLHHAVAALRWCRAPVSQPVEEAVSNTVQCGFESHPVRHLPSRKRSPDPAAAGFSRFFRWLCRWG